MEVNNIHIQPEAWDFNKARLSNPDLKDHTENKTTNDNVVKVVVEDGTQVTLSAKGLALSRTNGHNDVPIILGVIQQDKSEKNTPNTSRDKSPVEEIVDAKTSNVGILSLEQRRDIAKLRLRDMRYVPRFKLTWQVQVNILRGVSIMNLRKVLMDALMLPMEKLASPFPKVKLLKKTFASQYR